MFSAILLHWLELLMLMIAVGWDALSTVVQVYLRVRWNWSSGSIDFSASIWTNMDRQVTVSLSTSNQNVLLEIGDKHWELWVTNQFEMFWPVCQEVDWDHTNPNSDYKGVGGVMNKRFTKYKWSTLEFSQLYKIEKNLLTDMSIYYEYKLSWTNLSTCTGAKRCNK